MSYLVFDTVPAIGSIVRYSRRVPDKTKRETVQEFTLFDADAWRNGTPRLHWRSACNGCGAKYEFETNMGTRPFVRRCTRCRKAAPYKSKGWPEYRVRHELLTPEGEPASPDIDPASLF